MIALSLILSASAQENALQVKTKNGIVEGMVEENGVHAFKGIPFAAPPVGAYRWREPQPVQSWTGVRSAKKFGPRAMQTNVFGDMNFRSDGVSEDCLYLNIWRPAKASKKLLPVLVYYYGGGFVAGDGSEPRYDGASMATKDIISITVNYRLGAFGFLAHPELKSESPFNATGNYGLLDQAAALQWVYENIAAFGGDPKNITIAGESAGSVSVSALMASPLSRDMLAGAIGESGSVMGALPALPSSEGEKTGLDFMQFAGAGNLADLRAMNADSILMKSQRYGFFRFPRVIDGHFFPKDPYQIFAAGEQAHVPLLLGWNSEEMNAFALLGKESPTMSGYEKVVRNLYGANADRVLEQYKPNSDADVLSVATDLAGDRFISYSTWKWADEHAKTNQPVYRYLYGKPRPQMVAAMGDAQAGLAGGVVRDSKAPKMPPARGAVHSAEIEYAMGNLATNKVYDWSKDDYQVSKVMQEYFVNFVKTKNPNGKGLPQWPVMGTKDPVNVMHINVQSGAEIDKHSTRYRLMDELSQKSR